MRQLCSVLQFITGCESLASWHALGASALPLVHQPESGCSKLQKIAIRVAEIDAVAPARPTVLAFDSNGVRCEMRCPTFKLVFADCECDVQFARAPVSRNAAVLQLDGCFRRPLAKKQQHVPSNRIGGQTIVAEHRL